MNSMQDDSTKVLYVYILFSQLSTSLMKPFEGCIINPLGDAALQGIPFKSICVREQESGQRRMTYHQNEQLYIGLFASLTCPCTTP